MLRGLLGGVSLGAVVSAGVLGVASVVGPPPIGNEPPPPPQTDTQGVTQTDTEDSGPAIDPLDAGPETAPLAGTPEAPAGEDAPEASSPLEMPETSDVADLPDAPDSGEAAAMPDSPSDATDLAQVDPPDAPPADEDPVVGTDVLDPPEAADAPDLGSAPAGDAAPEALAEVDGDAPSSQPSALETPEGEDLAFAAPAPETEPQVGAAPDSPEAPGAEQAADTPQPPESEPETAEPPGLEQPDDEPAPSADTAEPEPLPAAEPTEDPDEAIVVDIVEDPAEEAPIDIAPGAEEGEVTAEDAPVEESADEPQEEGSTGTRFALSSETGSSLPGQQVGSVIDTDAAAEAEAATDTALTTYGAGVPADGRPLVSVLLIDDGSIPNAIEVLNTLPMQVTVAIDPESANASEAAAAYRAVGIEVAIISPIPPRATAQDVSVAFDAAFALVPEAALIVDLGGGGLAGISPTDHAMEIFAERGLGFATVSRGLNAAVRAANEAGVPAGVFSRDLDSEDQDARVIRRFLERAVFQARQGEDVALIARLRPDTVSALILWATASQLDAVQVAPMSTMLLKAEGDG